MPIWKSPSHSPPDNKEAYLAKVIGNNDPVVCEFRIASKCRRLLFPKFHGYMITTDGKAYQVWADKSTQVLKYKLLVPHL